MLDSFHQPKLLNFNDITSFRQEDGKFLEVLSKLEINSPFIDTIKDMPSYAKFLKEVFIKQKEAARNRRRNTKGECSAI